MTAERVQEILTGALPIKGLLQEFEETHAEKISLAKRMIACVEDPRRQLVLQLRYLEGKPWKDISKQMFYSRPTVIRFHNLGIGEIAERYQDD